MTSRPVATATATEAASWRSATRGMWLRVGTPRSSVGSLVGHLRRQAGPEQIRDRPRFAPGFTVASRIAAAWLRSLDPRSRTRASAPTVGYVAAREGPCAVWRPHPRRTPSGSSSEGRPHESWQLHSHRTPAHRHAEQDGAVRFAASRSAAMSSAAGSRASCASTRPASIRTDAERRAYLVLTPRPRQPYEELDELDAERCPARCAPATGMAARAARVTTSATTRRAV